MEDGALPVRHGASWADEKWIENNSPALEPGGSDTGVVDTAINPLQGLVGLDPFGCGWRVVGYRSNSSGFFG